jgi:hypothetical protein
VWNGVLYPDQPFVVLREATFEESVAEQIERGEAVPVPRCDASEALFYEVSMD